MHSKLIDTEVVSRNGSRRIHKNLKEEIARSRTYVARDLPQGGR